VRHLLYQPKLPLDTWDTGRDTDNLRHATFSKRNRKLQQPNPLKGETLTALSGGQAEPVLEGILQPTLSTAV